MEDTKVAALAINLEIENDILWLIVVKGIALPFGPPGGAPLSVPTGMYRIPFTKEAAEATGLAMVEGSHQLPDTQKPSDLVLAKSMAGIDDLAKAQHDYRSNG